MSETRIKTYLQERDAEYLKEHPQERWRCDLWPASGGDFHGVGYTEALAILNAATAYSSFVFKQLVKP